ncbi:hypothetical protein DPMN_142702 [Dreissena polymorpha]|uniref:Uncharacterized protein n=1 Tax=Dreissena polymorpha TaxID=45954 RepID=A0A9D4GC57_DREPO|nr:hypothetical protein DPMN_142702 [Dreissena polymorpha]
MHIRPSFTSAPPVHPTSCNSVPPALLSPIHFLYSMKGSTEGTEMLQGPKYMKDGSARGTKLHQGRACSWGGCA